jgi:hypothetical protein
MFPGWFMPVAESNGCFAISGGRTEWQPVDFGTFCNAIDVTNERMAELVVEVGTRH